MKKWILFIVLLTHQAHAFEVIQEVEVDYLLDSRFKRSIFLKAPLAEGGANAFSLEIDCQDGRVPTNTIAITNMKFGAKENHTVFRGLGDFYCLGLFHAVIEDLKVGDFVKLRVTGAVNQVTLNKQKFETVEILEIEILDKDDEVLSSLHHDKEKRVRGGVIGKLQSFVKR